MDRFIQALHDPFIEWSINACLESMSLLIASTGLALSFWFVYKGQIKKRGKVVPNSFDVEAKGLPRGSLKRYREQGASPIRRAVILCTIIAASVFFYEFAPQIVAAFNTTAASAIPTATVQTTATVIAANPYPSYLPGKGTLILSDPLNQSQHGQTNDNWGNYLDTKSNASCQFQHGAYLASQSKSRYSPTNW